MSNGGSGSIAPTKASHPRLIRLCWLSLFRLAARSMWREVFFSPVAIQSSRDWPIHRRYRQRRFWGIGPISYRDRWYRRVCRRRHDLVAGRLVGASPEQSFPQSQFVLRVCEQRQTVEGTASAYAGKSGSLPPLGRRVQRVATLQPQSFSISPSKFFVIPHAPLFYQRALFRAASHFVACNRHNRFV
jgi:hypothetical protein